MGDKAFYKFQNFPSHKMDHIIDMESKRETLLGSWSFKISHDLIHFTGWTETTPSRYSGIGQMLARLGKLNDASGQTAGLFKHLSRRLMTTLTIWKKSFSSSLNKKVLLALWLWHEECSETYKGTTLGFDLKVWIVFLMWKGSFKSITVT